MTIIPGTSGEWFNTKRLNRYAKDCPLWMVNGVRGVGKTVFGMQEIADNWDQGYQTVWSRLYARHMERGTFVDNFLNAGKRLGIIPDAWITTKDGVFTDENKREQPVLFMDMNGAYSHQGNEYNDVMRLISDEYTVRAGEQYPHSYAGKVHSLLGTLGRGKEDFRAILFSNWTSVSNPIWGVAGIYPGKKDVSVFRDKGMAIEICRNHYYNQDMPEDNSPMGRVLTNLGGIVMEDASEDASYTLVDPIRPAVRPSNMVLATAGGLYRQWVGATNYYEPCSIQAGDWVFTNDIRKVGAGIRLIPNQTLQRLRKEIEEGYTRFINQTCLYNVMSFIYARYQ